MKVSYVMEALAICAGAALLLNIFRGETTAQVNTVSDPSPVAVVEETKPEKPAPEEKPNTNPKEVTFRIGSAVGFSVGDRQAITANHVIRSAGDTGEIELMDGKTCGYQTVKADEGLDLALLEIDCDLPGVRVTNEIPAAGTKAFAYGTPGTPGRNQLWWAEAECDVVAEQSTSAMGNPDIEVTTACIAPGFSGGPVYLEDGTVFAVVSNGEEQGRGPNWVADIPADFYSQ